MIVGEREPVYFRDCGPDLAALVARPAWHRHAACRGRSDLPWIPATDRLDPRCATVCAACIVRAVCLTCGTEGNEVGIWGGTSSRERGRRAIPCEVCGQTFAPCRSDARWCSPRCRDAGRGRAV